MATRDASIWRSVIQAHSMAFKPYSPNANDSAAPRLASTAATHLLSVLSLSWASTSFCSLFPKIRFESYATP